jgi:hypothetical protein
MSAVLAAVEAEQSLFNTCLNGAIAQHATRLRRDLSGLAQTAEGMAAGSRRGDPVVRMALARLALSLDDALLFEGSSSAKRTRIQLLRAAASRAEAAAAMAPEAPGPHRTLAVIRARLAELDSRTALWDIAISEAERARELDVADRSLAELLWTLHLRAGHWDEARLWQERVEGAAGVCETE